MTLFTQELWNAARVKVPYLVCRTGVSSIQTLKLMFSMSVHTLSVHTLHSTALE